MTSPCFRFLFAMVALGIHTHGSAEDPSLEQFAQEFQETIAPLIQSHCLACHDAETREAELDLSLFEDLDAVRKSHASWELILERVEANEMPPEEAERPLDASTRSSLVTWLRELRRFDASLNAGDPGPVLARRLSNAEYDHSIRDLTGIDIRPTQTFPVDPANEAGFDNSGESLAMSPALMGKYLEAARTVAEHLLLTPSGLRFAPHPVVTDTDRDKYCVKRIVAFYQRQPTDYADYFFAAWSVAQRHPLQSDLSNTPSGNPLAEIAKELSLSDKYLSTLWHALNDQPFEYGPMAAVQNEWREILAITSEPASPSEQARVKCRDLAEKVIALRRHFEPRFDNLQIDGVHKGSQAFVIWKNKQYAAHRRTADSSFLDRTADELPTDSSLLPPTDQNRDAYRASCETFCSVFPDAFYISERGRDYLGLPKEQQEKGRLLSAGFHSMMGYFRDDQPLYDLVLDQEEQQELDELWQELDFISLAPQRQYQGLLWFERTDSGFLRDPQFDFARPEDKQSLSEREIQKLSRLYLAKAKASGGEGVAMQAIADFFEEMNAQIRWVEQAHQQAESLHLQSIVAFAENAFRRPLSSADEDELREFYRILREEQQLSHSQAIEDTLVSILVSPRFSYRVDLLSDSDERRPLDDFELASRLSYFLWASLPDDELRQLAARGVLHQPDVLLQQTRRMLADDRVRGFATEFAANWLDIRRFEEHNSVDRKRFPSFDNALRSAMFEEPMRFFIDVVKNDRSVLDFLYARDTFVNGVLAQHYGIEFRQGDLESWQHVHDASRYGRGGLLPMSVFLTKNAPGLRTSPVKRGYWVVRRLLGEHIPPPPPNVPELPADESKLGELTLREALARHRDHVACAGCHNRFDAIGIALEGYGPIGERRSEDLGGRPVDTLAVFPDGSQRDGIDDLLKYLQQQREDDFLENLSRKLLAYALSRTLQLSDDSLRETMQKESQADHYRFGKLVESIVTSPQFLNKRGRLGNGG